MTSFKIRGIKGEDWPELRQVLQKSLTADPSVVNDFPSKVFLDQNCDTNSTLVATSQNGSPIAVVVSFIRKYPIEDMPDDSDRSWIPLFAVDPEYRRQGVATGLFDRVEDWLKAQNKNAILIGPYTPNWWTPGVDAAAYPQAMRFLQNREYEEVIRPLAMDCNLLEFRYPEWTIDKRAMLLKSGRSFAQATARDMPDLFSFLKREFPGDWQRHIREVCREYLRTGADIVERVLVARDADGDVVGFSHYDNCRFGPFGTSASVRGQGFGAVLLADTLQSMRAKGLHNAFFMWTSDDAARLYATCGFKETRRFSLMKKDLTK